MYVLGVLLARFKLYFTLYDITSATYTAKYIDEVLEMSANDKKVFMEFFFEARESGFKKIIKK